MFRNASLFLLQRLKGSMSGDAHDFNIIMCLRFNQYCDRTAQHNN